MICKTLPIVPTLYRSFDSGSSIKGSSCATTKIWRSPSSAFSRDDIEDGAPGSVEEFNVQLTDSDIKSNSEPEFQESSSGVDLTAAELI